MRNWDKAYPLSVLDDEPGPAGWQPRGVVYDTEPSRRIAHLRSCIRALEATVAELQAAIESIGTRRNDGPARKYDSTVARIAGNILSGRLPAIVEIGETPVLTDDDMAAVSWAVALARDIVNEVIHTERDADAS